MSLEIVDNAGMYKLTQEERLLQSRIVEMRLHFAKEALAVGNEPEAERLLKQSLREAEAAAGENSALVGLALLELADLYDRQGRNLQASLLWDRIRNIMVEHS